MTVNYSINGGSEVHGVESSWERIVKRTGLLETVYSNIAINRWGIPQMDMSTYEGLSASQGNTLSSIETNDIADRNSPETYTTVTLGLVNGEHIGKRMVNVTLEFYVKVL
jgi:hypothetical protein